MARLTEDNSLPQELGKLGSVQLRHMTPDNARGISGNLARLRLSKTLPEPQKAEDYVLGFTIVDMFLDEGLWMKNFSFGPHSFLGYLQTDEFFSRKRRFLLMQKPKALIPGECFAKGIGRVEEVQGGIRVHYHNPSGPQPGDCANPLRVVIWHQPCQQAYGLTCRKPRSREQYSRGGHH